MNRWSKGIKQRFVWRSWNVLQRGFSRSLQHQMNRRCIGWRVRWFVSMVMCGGGQRLVAPDEPTSMKRGASIHPMVLLMQLLANNSMDTLGYLYPLHSPIWGCWIVWKCRGVQDT
jgi:hypothetical protein